jgi:hypothetical protein
MSPGEGWQPTLLQQALFAAAGSLELNHATAWPLPNAIFAEIE